MYNKTNISIQYECIVYNLINDLDLQFNVKCLSTTMNFNQSPFNYSTYNTLALASNKINNKEKTIWQFFDVTLTLDGSVIGDNVDFSLPTEYITGYLVFYVIRVYLTTMGVICNVM